MIIELSKHEVDLIDKALTAWEHEETSSTFTGSLLAMMISPSDKRDEAKSEMKSSMDKAVDVSKQRRMQSTMLRAKLYQAASRDSEHVIDQ
jgi:hypothetical protein